MLTEVSPDKANTPTVTPQLAPARSVWWARLLARLPLSALYRITAFLGWATYRFFPYREHVVRENLGKAFPEFDETRIRAVIRSYYLGFAEVLAEVIKSVSLPAQELRQRVRIVNLDAPRRLLAAGQSVLLVAAHQCNWEWMLLALSLELGYPVDAAYKPLVDNWAEREMKKVRTRFGGRLVPAKELLADIIKRRDVVRAVAMVADQEPTTSEHKHWTRFLGRDTAFYMGAEEIARVTRFPVFFISMRRTARGCYEMELEPLSTAGESLPSGALTERYVGRVEQQIRAAPADWPWSHKRWKLRRPLYESRSRPAT
jgi:Kdo2-lipid IVA lauroyltransferase/acyltransferase